ncbi:hypothetical protein [Zavarzinia sp.]|uniref:hypothetical protein n=1 Tax=Zavarzinia sp. TaxID=2027920 RepID=UPI003BB68637
MRAIFGLLVAGMTLSGCAELNSIQYQFDNWSGASNVSTIDAKQRVVLTNTAARRDDKSHAFQVCVEQSPDTFSVFASSGSLSVETKEALAKAAVAVAESGASLAFRTQLTQAQSNLLYSICALSAAGALSDRAVRSEIRRFQNTLLAALAIEQVTSPYRGPITTTLTGDAAAEAGRNVEEAQAKLDAATKQRDAAKTAVADKEAALAKPGADVPTATKAVEDAKKALAEAEAKVALAEEILKASRNSLSAVAKGQSGGTTNIMTGNGSGVSSDVANAVSDIVDSALNRGVILDNCSEILFEAPEARDVNNAYILPYDSRVVELCREAVRTYMTAYAEREAAYAECIRKDGVCSAGGAPPTPAAGRRVASPPPPAPLAEPGPQK